MVEPLPRSARSFPRQLLAADAQIAARNLIGARLTRGSGPAARVARIVELEAYGGQEDLASHARFGPTKRNAVMFGPPGVAYVYLVYGMYNCLNVVTEAEGCAAAVLIRAVEPVQGHDGMLAARLQSADRTANGRDRAALELARRRINSLPVARLASGPGLVCAAFSVTRSDDGIDLCDPNSDLRIELAAEDEPLRVEAGPRVGVDYAPEPWRSRPWRFFVPGNESVSTAWSGPPRVRS
ncbi:MAG: DNA-3-methyladenine glycosylase [Candidatus Limnocylindrales bacterium]|jgi:DNA-3-methyladenine glycosylase